MAAVYRLSAFLRICHDWAEKVTESKYLRKNSVSRTNFSDKRNHSGCELKKLPRIGVR